MSGLFGTLAIEKVRLEGDTVKFKVTLGFGGQEFGMEFEGKLSESQLTGEFETSRGVQEVTGKKMMRGVRWRGRGEGGLSHRLRIPRAEIAMSR